jgi:uncharacterized repeat protein (TIGR01451 family)
MLRGQMRGRPAWIAVLVAVVAFFAIAGNAGAALKNGKVLILADTVSSGVIGSQSVEENAAASLGLGVDVVDDVTWSTMTTPQFAAYNAIVLGDPTCQGLSAATAAIANRGTWGAAVDGNKIFVGTDPVYHYRFTRSDIYQVTYNAVKFAADSASAGKTGIYISLSCYYHGTAPNTPVPLLDPFGSFSATGVGCYNDAHIVATHPALAGLTDAILSDWSCSVHEAFDSWPSTFLPLAIARGDFSGAMDFPDGSRGTPYILASGEGLHLISTIDLAPTSATNDVGASHTVTATVAENSTPVVGTTVTFTVLSGPNAGLTGTGVTDSAGQASFTYSSALAGTDTIEASYIDSAGKARSSNDVTKTWIVRNADLSVVKSGPAFVANGGPITYTVTVTNSGPAAAHNVVVTDAIPSSITGATATPSQGSCSGSFTCSLGDIASGSSATVTIHGTVSTSGSSVSNTASASSDNPDPDSSNNSSTTRATVFTMGSGGGAFVVGDQSATGSVTFWGAQWWKVNSLSGGSAPAAFKGFASAPASPACGVNWTTAPGNSPPPPAGPLPALMGVIVSSSISQSGSTISGNTVHVVIVQTNPGYDANPGHAGTGTVIATYC